MQNPSPRVLSALGLHGMVQHECDHLQGILYPMRITDFRLFGFTEVLFPGQAPMDE
jgi:peptide deformylase